MSIENNLNRLADAFESIAKSLERLTSPALTVNTSTAAAPAATTEAKKETKASTAAAAAPAETKEEEKTYTLDDLRALGRKLIAGDVKEPEIAAALKEVAGVTKMSQVPADKINAVHAKLTSMLP